MYRQMIFPLLQRMDAERTHERVLHGLALIEGAPMLRRVVQRLVAVDESRLHVDFCGLRLNNPLGIAAGLDKNAVAVQTWGALGFGHVEIGTVTPQPQGGNRLPRVFRLPEDHALINRMGFPGQGIDAVRRRLERLSDQRPVVGVNVGANKASVESGRAVDDYVAALERVYDVADYITINISSPNTARLRELQGRAALDALIREIVARRDALANRKPLLLKIAPDLTPSEIDDIVAVCVARGIDGIIAANTTLARPPSLTDSARSEIGGLSGAPLRDRATDIIRYLYASTRGTLPIIGVGGIFSADDAFNKLAAGARLVQVYTGFVYEGPLLARRINRGLIRLMEREGIDSVAQLIGCGVVAK